MKKILFGIFDIFLAWILFYIGLNGDFGHEWLEFLGIMEFILIILGIGFALIGVFGKDD